MTFVYKLAAFDLDGTLAPSKGEVSPSTASLLNSLSNKVKVAVISGASFRQFQIQLLPFITPNKNIILLPQEGTERFEYDEERKVWNMTDRKVFLPETKKEVIKVLNEIIASGQYEIPTIHTGEYIEDRDTEIAFSALGQQATLEEKERWDPKLSKRKKIKDSLESRLKDISVTIAGTTSINILPKGFTKAIGLGLLIKKIGLQQNEVVFVGDAIVPGGNDYSFLEEGFEHVKVKNPEETNRVIRTWLKPPVAFFCSEYALQDDPVMYAGGLGVLAGDYVLEIADQNFPFIAIGLKYGDKVPEEFSLLDFNIEIPNIGNVRVWCSTLAENVQVYLLDAGTITLKLYDPNLSIRIKQQIILGIGGIRLLKKLQIFPSVYHLNEGHTAMAAAAIVVERREDMDRIVATKHTILSDAGLLISKSDLQEVIGEYSGKYFEEIFEKGRHEANKEMFSTTKFLLSSAVRKNGVSLMHTVYEKKEHPSSQLIPITNGVYKKRWQAKEFHKATDEQLLNIKNKLRAKLCSYAEGFSGRKLNPNICTLVWARRFTSYKRPGLLFSDSARLANIVSNQRFPLQIIISGKAHPSDKEGGKMVEKVMAFSEDKSFGGRLAYLPNYSTSHTLKLVQGADIWLNTPVLGKEACGTSGMKAGLNGALQCSIPDGWVGEISLNGIGWSLPEGDTAGVLYDLLEHEILPCFYGEGGWISKMRSTMSLIEKTYTTARMLEQYEKELYN